MFSVLDFAIAHPILAVCLSVPTATVLISVSWCIANVLTSIWSTSCATVTTILAFLVTLVRGYAPVRKKDIKDDDDGNDGESGDDGRTERRPLAS